MEYRLNKEDLLKNMTAWNGFLHKKVHLIACGGTAMTLLGVKESTRDVDFMVPVEEEYRYLIKILEICFVIRFWLEAPVRGLYL
jgi:hypothetical protein